MKDNRVLIDTSVWIAYFRGTNRNLGEKTDEIIDSSVVCVPKVVIAELIQGAKTEKEVSLISGFSGTFTIIDQTEDSWIKAGRLSFEMKRKGSTVSLVDCYIAVLAFESKCAVFTLDAHFTTIRKYLKIDLME